MRERQQALEQRLQLLELSKLASCYLAVLHPSIQWRYTPNRALASSIEVP
jgi:hypothetical protein